MPLFLLAQKAKERKKQHIQSTWSATKIQKQYSPGYRVVGRGENEMGVGHVVSYLVCLLRKNENKSLRPQSISVKITETS